MKSSATPRTKISEAKTQAPNLRIDRLRSELKPLQRELLNEFWKHYQREAKWPSTRATHSRKGTSEVREALQVLGGDIVRELKNSPHETYELTLIGVLLTDEGSEYFQLLVRYITFLRTAFLTTPEKTNFDHKEIQAALKLSDPDTVQLGHLIQLAHFLGAASWGDSFWTIKAPKEIEYLPRDGDLDQHLDDWLFRDFRKSAVFADESYRGAVVVQNRLSDWIHSFGNSSAPTENRAVAQVDALKKRYQVFVSSTYEDLKEERHQTIQALLETKCIPTGMELFPATSGEQWELIQRIIEECDYYIVIVAGRYGSLSEAQIGFTEREYDYAVKIGKPVIGFYHTNPDQLPASKCEKTDVGRERLRAFTEKVKKRLCRHWSSPAELGSAVKSAILHELEFNPTPGWIRADMAAPSEQTEKMKQRIADLEEQLKARTRPVAERKEPQMTLTCDVIGKRNNAFDDLTMEVGFSESELILACDELFKSGEGWAWDLHSSFQSFLSPKVIGLAKERDAAIVGEEVLVREADFENVLHRLVSQKFLKVISNGWRDQRGAYLKVTDKGYTRYSEAVTNERK